MNRHRPFLWITLFFITGIILHNIWRPAVEIVAPASTVMVAAAYFYRRERIVFAVLILLCFVLLGWLCSHSHWLFAEDHIYFKHRTADFSGVNVRGVVAGDIRKTEIFSARRLSFEMDLREIKVGENWQRCSGKILVNLFQETPLQYGDDLVLTGKLSSPYDFSAGARFSYREYLKRRGIFFVLSVKKTSPVEILRNGQGNPLMVELYRWRSAGSRILAENFNPAEAALMQAMLLGEQTRIPQFLKDAFSRTGTTHILAISGLNVAIVVAVLFIFLRAIPGPRAMPYCLTMLFIVMYVLLTGASASVVRAGIMATVLLTGFVIEREADGINSLMFAAFLIVLLDPNNLFDIGFQLSFMSVLTILIFYPLFIGFLKPLFKKYPQAVLRFAAESVAVTLSATLGVGGLIAYYFHMITPVSLVANILVVPLSSAAVVLGMGMLASGICCAALVPLFGICIKLVLNFMVWTMLFFSGWPFAYFYIKDVTIWQVIGYYFIVTSFWLFLAEQDQRQKMAAKE